MKLRVFSGSTQETGSDRAHAIVFTSELPRVPELEDMLRNDWEDPDPDVGSAFVFTSADYLALSVSIAGYIRVFRRCTGEESSAGPEKSGGSDRAEPEERRTMPRASSLNVSATTTCFQGPTEDRARGKR